MTLPSNITKENLIAAADKIIKEGIPSDANSTTYDVLFESHLLPPKLLVSYANIFANNQELDRNTFKGDIETECFLLLGNNGFIVVEKDSYYPELNRFINQAQQEKSLKTKHYQKSYNGLNVKVSFGQGDFAKIPWISFLGGNQVTSNGIYPVYLYFKSIDKLILAYGISETNVPKQKWRLGDEAITITDYFFDKRISKPDRYGNSFVFKSYDLKEKLDPIQIDKDLSEMVLRYNQVLKQRIVDLDQAFLYKNFKKDTVNSGLIFSEKLISRYVSSLCTKPFVLLSGLSGSGKTKLAQSFAHWICENKDQYCIVPVGADWTNREPLLGYPNALDVKEYIKPENGVLDLLLKAKIYPTKPFFLILDEMNLSHVERYFADFLSAMESGDAIPLHSATTEISGVPNKIKLPKNLFIVGTVNIDETTYMFSPKVLDRANVIEFRIDSKDIEAYLSAPKKIELEKLEGMGAGMGESFVILSQKEFDVDSNDDLKKVLVEFFVELKKSGAEFGYRSAGEINRLVNMLVEVEKVSDTDAKIDDKKIDIAIMQKLLPKVHGSRRKLEPILTTLGSFCVNNGMKVKEEIFETEKSIDFKNDKRIKFPLSLEKICRMYKGAVDNGFASYAEA